MEFVGVKELSQNLKKYMREKAWVIVTWHGKPRKILKDLTEEDLGQFFQGRSEVHGPGRPPLQSLGAFGMWKARKEMGNSVAWVRRLRRNQGLRSFK